MMRSFDVDTDTLKFDSEKMQADIETYGRCMANKMQIGRQFKCKNCLPIFVHYSERWLMFCYVTALFILQICLFDCYFKVFF